MFERFTDESRSVLVRAQELGTSLKSPFLRRHHLLIATIDREDGDPNGVVSEILDDAEVDRNDLRAKLLASLQASETPANDDDGSIPFSGGAKKALEMALREALSLGHNYISSAHLFLSILRTADGPLAETLGGTSLDYDRARGVARTVAPERVRRGRGGRDVRAQMRDEVRSAMAEGRRGPGGPGGRGGFGGRRGRWMRDESLSIGLRQVLRRLDAEIEARPATTGDLLVAMVDTPDTHFASIVANTPLTDAAAVKAAAAKLLGDDVPDGVEKDTVTVDPDTGAVTIHDPEVAKRVMEMLRDK